MPDNLKQQVADEVYNAIEDDTIDALMVPGIYDIELERLSPLQTIIKVKPINGPRRHFMVQVKEQM